MFINHHHDHLIVHRRLPSHQSKRRKKRKKKKEEKYIYNPYIINLFCFSLSFSISTILVAPTCSNKICNFAWRNRELEIDSRCSLIPTDNRIERALYGKLYSRRIRSNCVSKTQEEKQNRQHTTHCPLPIYR